MEVMQEPLEEMRAAQGGLRPEDPTPALVLDVETTGLDPREDRIIQIGLCSVHMDPPREFQTLVNPEGRKSGKKAAAVHGLKDSELAKAQTFREILPALLEFCGDLPLIAHNADFDLAFVAAEVKRCGDPAGKPLAQPKRWTCSLEAARRILPMNRRWNLDDAARALGVSPRTARDRHDALVDADLAARCWERMGGSQTGPEQEALFSGSEGADLPWIERARSLARMKEASHPGYLIQQVQEHGALALQ